LGECELSEPERIMQYALQAAAALPPAEVHVPDLLLSQAPPQDRCARDAVLATLRRQLHEGEEQLRLLELAALLPHFIVQYRGLPLRFTVTASGVCAPMPCYPWNATRLSRAQAKLAASRVGNGGGYRGETVPVATAVALGVCRLRRLVARMEGLPA